MLPQRKQIRLRHYDYSSNGWYFVTICTKNRIYHFGSIRNKTMYYSPIGQQAMQCWLEIPRHYPFVELGAHVIMPNHVHGIIGIFHKKPQKKDADKQFPEKHISPKSDSLSRIVGSYKSAVTKWCNSNGHQSFKWHYRFHDHIIRNSWDYRRIHDYILNNVNKWEDDRFHGSAM